jgi:hypothetical protein
LPTMTCHQGHHEVIKAIMRSSSSHQCRLRDYVIRAIRPCNQSSSSSRQYRLREDDIIEPTEPNTPLTARCPSVRPCRRRGGATG